MCATFENGTPADAIICNDAEAYLLIRVADCVPILLSTADGKFVAAVHAGWRGVVAEIVPRAVQMLAAISKSPAREIITAIGPCISREYFEVGPEVVTQFVDLFDHDSRWADRHVDLPAAVNEQLRASGVEMDRIDRTDRCTLRDETEFFSHRRDRGITGRMAAVIAPVSA